MRKSRYLGEKIIRVRERVESDQEVMEVIREQGISNQTDYRCK
jgi:hypothetical protein